MQHAAVVPADRVEELGAEQRRTLGEKEAAVRGLLQVEDELVEVGRDADVVVEVLVEVGFAVAVQVVQDA